MSINIGLRVTENLKSKVKFWNDQNLEIRRVGNTCERCEIADCNDRVAEPIVLERKLEGKLKKEAVKNLINEEY